MRKVFGLFFLIIVVWILGLKSNIGVRAQSGLLLALEDLIGDDTESATNIPHSVSFTLPNNSLPIISTDYIQIDLSAFSNVTAPGSLSGTYSGTPVFDVVGTRARVTGIVVLPGKEISIEGIDADNPAVHNDANYTVFVTVTSDAAGLIVKNQSSTVAVENLGFVDVTAAITTPQARLELSGYTGPNSFVVVISGETASGTDVSSAAGYFSKVFSSLTPNTYYLTIRAVDDQSRSTSLLPLEIYTPVYQTTTVQNILLSPTISISSTSVDPGSPLYATGSAKPGAQITVMTESPLRTYSASAGADGEWTTAISNTDEYITGDYKIYSLAQNGAVQSLLSPSFLFTINPDSGAAGGSACGDISGGDLDCDGEVDLTDFSILMFYWGSTNLTADINSDGFVGLIDFSILMYYWGS